MKVEEFEVEKKSFQVKFEGSNGRTWISITKRSRGFVVSIGFGKEEVEWLTEHLKKVVELEASRGFMRKIREFVTKRKPLILVVPEGVKGNGWEALRMAISSVQVYSDQAGRVSKETFEDAQASKDIYKGCWSYAKVVAEDGPRNGTRLSVGKWARAVVNAKKKLKIGFTSTEWFQDQGRLLVRGRSILLRRWSPRENMVVVGKFKRGWLELKGLPFHLWDEDQLKFIMKKWGRVTKVARESLNLVDLSKVKLWVEMLPNVMLPALLEGQVVESGRLRLPVVKECRGANAVALRMMSAIVGGFFPGHVFGFKFKFGVQKGEWLGGSLLGPEEGIINGPNKTLAQPVRAQIGLKNSGLPAGPVVIQAHETVALSSLTSQRAGSSTKVAPLFARSQGPVEVRAGGDEAFSEDDGWAFERKAQSLPNPSPPSATINEDSERVLSFTINRQGIESSVWGKGPRHQEAKRLCAIPILKKTKKVLWAKWGPIFEIHQSRIHLLVQKSEPPEYSSIPSYGLALPLPSPSGPDLPSSVSLSQPPMENRETQLALSNQMSECFNPSKSKLSLSKEVSNLVIGSQGDTMVSGEFHIDGMSPRKMAKVREVLSSLEIKVIPGRRTDVWNTRGLGSRNKRRVVKDFLSSKNLDVVMIQETKKMKCDRRFVGSVWTVRNKDWAAIPACGASDGILIIWDSKKLHSEEVVIGSFSVSVKFDLVGCGSFWISAVL
ncbi:hypothetical protein CK203_091549 [Vitis vinifera]|uniref:Uncharacterized protein n=1 Tax=Vitis vinifera TaxID=29760 RepID=A0A438ED78_VITVI|nr:hypothetical protein CK203_091549 [Vitis vinifera]